MQFDKEYTQEIFDTVYSALIKQGHRSLDETGQSCRYRGLRGSKCAVGHLIKDHVYDPAIEGWAASSGDVKDILVKSGIELEKLPMYFLEKIQSAHDHFLPKPLQAYSIGSSEDFTKKMQDIAKSYSLTFKA